MLHGKQEKSALKFEARTIECQGQGYINTRSKIATTLLSSDFPEAKNPQQTCLYNTIATGTYWLSSPQLENLLEMT